MQAPSLPNVISMPAPSAARSIALTFVATDPDVVHELEKRPEGKERDEYACHALRLGVLALRQAAGFVDAESIRREGERILADVRGVLMERTANASEQIGAILSQYLDPSSGTLPQRLEALTKKDGEIERVLARHLDANGSTLAETLAKTVGEQSPIFKLLSPEQSNGLIATLTKTIDQALAQQRDTVLAQFSLDRKDSALSRLVTEVTGTNGKLRAELATDLGKVTKEFSLDNKNGALSRLVGRVETAQKTIVQQLSLDHENSALQRLSTKLDTATKAIHGSLTLDDAKSPLARMKRELMDQLKGFEASNNQFYSEVKSALEAMKARKAEADRSPAHGLTFEEAVGDLVAKDAQRAGDLHEIVGTKAGRSARKVGDHVLTLGAESAAPGAKIVVEAKSHDGYTEKLALDELAVARKNREAQVGVFVFARGCALDGLETFRRHGRDILCVWDADDPSTDVVLRAALSLARALAVRERAAADLAAASVKELDALVDDLEEHAARLDKIASAAQNVRRHGDNIVKQVDEMRSLLGEQAGRLRVQVSRIRRQNATIAGAKGGSDVSR